VNAMGQQIYNANYDGELVVNLISSNPSGIYIVSFSSAKANYAKKIIIN
jgi:hypothetical protein